ncbi:hypothetical protein ACQP10_38420 (plasmid) [Streptosporangium sandarakinum]|uniref:hypothetical protein n=1 Tax=Streptosporangium sandarakinum TaxID=1260955 RepID=UPI003D909663
MPPSSAQPRPTYTIPAGTTPEEAHRLGMLQFLDKLRNGLCPHCGDGLQRAVGDSRQTPGTGLPWLECGTCPCYWQVDLERQEVTWEQAWAWQGIDPFRPRYLDESPLYGWPDSTEPEPEPETPEPSAEGITGVPLASRIRRLQPRRYAGVARRYFRANPRRCWWALAVWDAIRADLREGGR